VLRGEGKRVVLNGRAKTAFFLIAENSAQFGSRNHHFWLLLMRYSMAFQGGCKQIEPENFWRWKYLRSRLNSPAALF